MLEKYLYGLRANTLSIPRHLTSFNVGHAENIPGNPHGAGRLACLRIRVGTRNTGRGESDISKSPVDPAGVASARRHLACYLGVYRSLAFEKPAFDAE